MPATSKAQQRLMAWAYACKTGKTKKCPIRVQKLANQMDKKALRDFAKTKQDDLPEKVKDIKEGIISKFDLQRIADDATKKGHFGYPGKIKTYEEFLLKDCDAQTSGISTLSSINGMGPVVLPGKGTTGSGDIFTGLGYSRKKKKNKPKWDI